MVVVLLLRRRSYNYRCTIYDVPVQRQLSLDVPACADFSCDKAAVLKKAMKWVFHVTNKS